MGYLQKYVFEISNKKKMYVSQKILVKHNSYDFKGIFDGKKFNSNEKWNVDKH